MREGLRSPLRAGMRFPVRRGVLVPRIGRAGSLEAAQGSRVWTIPNSGRGGRRGGGGREHTPFRGWGRKLGRSGFAGKRPTREEASVPAFSDASRRLIGASSAVAALCGLVVGPLTFSGVPTEARLFYGGAGGLVLGGLIGAVAGLAGLLTATLARASGAVSVERQRTAFVVVGSATALLGAWAVLPPMGPLAKLALLVPLAAATFGAGTVVGRRYIS